MKGYPKVVLKKQDYINLLSIKEHKTRALADLKHLYTNDDTHILTTTTRINPEDPESDWNQEMLPNSSPLWKQKGFESREELAQIIQKNGGKKSDGK